VILVSFHRRNQATVTFRPKWWQLWRRETERFVERLPTIPYGAHEWRYLDHRVVPDDVRRAIDAEERRIVWEQIWEARAAQ
jgi:hypothetical protein